MRKNKMMRTASALLVATLLTTSVISGTFAKYTSTASAEDSARVAKWSFKVGDKDIVANETISFDLFNTVKEADTENTEEHLQKTDGTIIAPGTGGSFDIVLTNESEVTAKYAIDFTETNESKVPVEYKIGTDGEWTADISTLNIKASDSAEDTLAYANGTKTITVYWRWAYEAADTPVKEQSDVNDTKLGAASTATVAVSAKITATQVD